MKKIICSFITIITLVSCSNEDDYATHPNDSFNFKVTKSVNYQHPNNDLNTWVEVPNDIFFATPTSRIFYDDVEKAIIMKDIGRNHDLEFSVILENGLYFHRDNLKEKSTFELKNGYIEFLIYYNDETYNKIIFTVIPFK